MSLDSIFKAYDIRGLVPEELNEGVACVVGQAFADFLHEVNPDTRSKPVIVGYDMRSDSAALANALITGLTSQGRDVINIGQVASDMIYFAVGSLEAAGGVMVTASHNPGAYNGMKFCREQAAPVGAGTGLESVKAAAKSGLFRQSGNGNITSYKIMDAWISHALKFAPSLKPFRLAVDAGNGMAGAVIPHLESQTSLKITPLYFELDGSFPNHEANPIKPETLVDLSKTVVDNQLDFGIAFDGDGDRMMLVDELGEPVSGSILTAVLSEYFLRQHPGSAILFNAICSRVVEETVTKHGGKPVRTKVGHPYIKSAMREHDAPFGGEHSAHYYFRDNWSADSGLVAALTAMQVLSETDKALSVLAAPYREAYVQSGELNFEAGDKTTLLSKLANSFADGEQDQLDGLSVNYTDWWFNVRFSNTEPLLRLNVEARNSKLLAEKLELIKGLIAD